MKPFVCRPTLLSNWFCSEINIRRAIAYWSFYSKLPSIKAILNPLFNEVKQKKGGRKLIPCQKLEALYLKGYQLFVGIIYRKLEFNRHSIGVYL